MLASSVPQRALAKNVPLPPPLTSEEGGHPAVSGQAPVYFYLIFWVFDKRGSGGQTLPLVPWGRKGAGIAQGHIFSGNFYDFLTSRQVTVGIADFLRSQGRTS